MGAWRRLAQPKKHDFCDLGVQGHRAHRAHRLGHKLFTTMKAQIRFLLFLSLVCCRLAAETAIPLGSHLELFVDDLLLDRCDGTALRLHEPALAGVACGLIAPGKAPSAGTSPSSRTLTCSVCSTAECPPPGATARTTKSPVTPKAAMAFIGLSR